MVVEQDIAQQLARRGDAQRGAHDAPDQPEHERLERHDQPEPAALRAGARSTPKPRRATTDKRIVSWTRKAPTSSDSKLSAVTLIRNPGQLREPALAGARRLDPHAAAAHSRTPRPRPRPRCRQPLRAELQVEAVDPA